MIKGPEISDLDLNISRARVILSIVALLSIYIDPATGGIFFISRYALITLTLHLIYSLTTWLALRYRHAPAQLAAVSTAMDILFAAAVAVFTEGPTSASYIFFVFAIIAVDCRTGFRATLTVTFCSGILYFLLLVTAGGAARHLYAMRAAYLAITGYLIGFIGQQRANYEARLRELETIAERHRIARSLHDGYIQVLAAMALRLETCRELLARGRAADSLTQITELQNGVSREFDEVRAYVRSLADLDLRANAAAQGGREEMRIRIEAAFEARGLVVEQIIQIMLEGMRNSLRHGNARRATITAAETGGIISVRIDDDGVGFAATDSPPWAIASRVAEFGGWLKMSDQYPSGAHLEIELPAA